MRGVLEGVHIVSYHWFLASLTGHHFVPERDYWIRGDEVIGRATDAVERSIRHVQNDSPPLFKGLSFYLLGAFAPPSPPKTDLSALIVAGGGRVVARKPHSTSPNDLWVIHDGTSSPTYHHQHASWSQLLDCISLFSLDPLLRSPSQPDKYK